MTTADSGRCYSNARALRVTLPRQRFTPPLSLPPRTAKFAKSRLPIGIDHRAPRHQNIQKLKPPPCVRVRSTLTQRICLIRAHPSSSVAISASPV